VSASLKLRWKRYINELRFSHEELEILKEISNSAGTDFHAFYEAFCAHNNLNVAELNRKHAERVAGLYSKPEIEDGKTNSSQNSDVDGALVIHKESSQENIDSGNDEETAAGESEYQMTKDEKDIHEAFHKVFKKLAMILHPDKLTDDLTPEQKKERLKMFKEAKEAFENRKYFSLLELAEKFNISTPRNYKQQIRWMRKETSTLSEQIKKEKNTYNYMFSECETDEQRNALVRNFLNQVFGI
jgi:hypothetical protein